MKKVYLDKTEIKEAMLVFIKDVEIISSGTTINSMSIKYKNSEYQRYADTYGLKFIFDDYLPYIDFYTVPLIDIFATDSLGGMFGTIGQTTDMDEIATVCYINMNKECYLIADSLKDFLQMLSENYDWKSSMILNNNVIFYKSKADAEENLEFLEIHKEIKDKDC